MKKITDSFRLVEAQKLSHIGNWELDIKNNLFSWSDESFRIFEIDPHKFGGTHKDFLNIIHPEDRQKVNQTYSNSLATRQPYSLDYRLLLPNGRTKFVHEECVTYYDSYNQPIRSIGTVQDITAQKKSEEALFRANRTIKTLRACTKTLLQSSSETNFLSDICRNIVQISGYTFAWIGYAEDNLGKQVRPVGKFGFESGYLKTANITWADIERGRGPTGTAIRTGKPQIVRNIVTDPKFSPWRKQALKRGYLSSIALPIKVGEGRGALNIYSSFSNPFDSEELALLTELAEDLSYGIKIIRNDEKKRIAEQRLLKLDAIKNQFIRIVSHQLRTPLSSARWSLELILDKMRGKIPLDLEKLLNAAHQENLVIIHKLNDLLESLNIEEKRIKTVLEKIDLSRIFREVCGEASQQAKHKHLHFNCSSAQTISTYTDPSRVRVTMKRLLDNSITYTPEGGSVKARLTLKGNDIRFEVKDTGIGISASERQDIFEKFFRGSKATEYAPNSFGLSLYLCKNTIESLGGKIGFTSVEHKGSTFWFTLPAE